MQFLSPFKTLLALLVVYLSGITVSQSQIRFIPNGGQWNKTVKFRADLINGHLWITDSGLLFNQWDAKTSENIHENYLGKIEVKGHVYRLEFLNGNFSNCKSTGQISETYYNFFIGNNPSNWASGLHSTDKILVKDLYAGVDLEIYEVGGRLKYDLICNNTASWEQIKFKYNGVESIELHNNVLNIKTSVQDFTESLPLISGISNGTETAISGNYSLENEVIQIKLDAKAKSFKKVIIDPVLVFSTFTGSRADNFGCTGTYDENGNAISGGTVFGVGYPRSIGAYQTTFGGGQSEDFGYGGARDAAIIKYTPDGRNMLFATYVGGEDNEQPHSMVCDSFGNIYILGSTRSDFFPTSTNAVQRNNMGDYDFFIFRLSADGTQMLASTLVGGSGGSSGLDCVGANRGDRSLDDYKLIYNYADEFRGEIITDNNLVFVVGNSYSGTFPAVSGEANKGEEDGVAMCLTGDLSTIKWAHMLGGNDFDALYGVAFGANNNLFVSGGTASQNLNQIYPAFVNSYLGGIADGYIMQLDKNTGAVLSGRYVGTADYDQCYFVQTDNTGNPYIFGITEGTVPNVFANFHQAGKPQFIQRFEPGLANITLSSAFGSVDGKPNLSPSAFLVDKCERIFISGWGGSTNDHLAGVDQFGNYTPKTHRNKGNTFGLTTSADAVQKRTDGSDFYVAVFSRGMYNMLYGTFFGGLSSGGIDAEEHVDGGTSRFDKKGIIYQSICGGCGRNGLFPTTPNAYSRSMNSNNCNNAMFKLDFENLNQKPKLKDTFIQVVATQPININLQGSDADLTDSLFFIIDWLNRGNLPLSDTPTYTVTDRFGNKGFGIGTINLNVKWDTRCKSWFNDTLKLRVRLFDRGCPKADTSTIIVKILVTKPPKANPVDALCVSFDRITGKLKIDWPATTQPAGFFRDLILYRKNPDNSVVELQKITDNTVAGFYMDQLPTDPYADNYCYYISAWNICNEDSTPPSRYCTVSELNTPINSTKIRFVTVENDRTVNINWFKSDEQDFKQYEVYRFKPGTVPNSRYAFKYTADTSFYDSSFDVDKENYCYGIMVTDKCGHVSKLSNQGCNIIIEGSKTGRPWYFFDLDWQRYTTWENGVANWTLERQYGPYKWGTVGITDSATRIFRDDKLNYDWGGYYYRVTATENAPTNGAKPAQSQSNWIYLWQAPELWVPNAFTENRDVLNDSWGIVPVFVKTYDMKVFNRWGQKVWETQNKKQQWDGMVNGKRPQDAVFAWYVVFTGWDNKTYQMKGTVTILH